MKRIIVLLLFAPLMVGAFSFFPPKDVIKKYLEKWKTYITSHPGDKVYISNDKPLYYPGEKVWFSVFVRNAGDLRASAQSDVVYIEVYNPKGNLERAMKLTPIEGVAKGDFSLGSEAPGGIYKIVAYTWWQKNDKNAIGFTREIQVQDLIIPNIKLSLEFDKESYNKGESGICTLKAESIENQPLANHSITYTLQVEGKTMVTNQATTDNKGNFPIPFSLPQNLKTADALLNVTTVYRDKTEAISRSIPVKIDNIAVEFFAEGGDALADYPMEYAFRALDIHQKPAEAKGSIVDKQGKIITAFETTVKGMGKVSFVPKAGESYYAIVAQNGENAAKIELPKAKSSGLALQVSSINKDKLMLNVYASKEGNMGIVLQLQEKNYFARNYHVIKGKNCIEIPIEKFPLGVAQITLIGENEHPVAERLVMIHPEQKLNINITTDKNQYGIQDTVHATLEVKDAQGTPLKGNFAVSVVNEQLLTFLNDKNSDLLSWMLIESELKGQIHEPRYYFDPNISLEKQLLAMDYLLMTAGWRRYTWKEVESYTPKKALTYKKEYTSLKGVVRDRYTEVSHAEVWIEGIVSPFYTDKEGKIDLQHIPIPTIISIKKDSLVGSYSIYYPTTSVQYWYISKTNKPSQKKPTATTSPTPTITQAASSGGAKVSGIVKDYKGDVMPYAVVMVMRGEEIINGAITDENGYYSIMGIEAGNYTLHAEALGSTIKIEGVPVYEGITRNVDIVIPKQSQWRSVNANVSDPIINNNSSTFLNQSPLKKIGIIPMPAPASNAQSEASVGSGIIMSDLLETEAVIITEFKIPTFERDPSAQGATFNGEQIRKMPSRNIQTLASLTPGAYLNDEGDVNISFRGAREGGTVYMIDGVKVRGSATIPQSAIGSMQVITGGVPAEFGDFTGGMINITTSPISTPRYYYPIENYEPEKPEYTFYSAKEYAAPIRSKSQNPDERTDFRTTLYWNGNVKTNEKGIGTFSFTTSDEIAAFRIKAEGISESGIPGQQAHLFYTKTPFSMEVKLPIEVVRGDSLVIPITLTNNTSTPLKGILSLTTPNSLMPIDTLITSLTLSPNASQTIFKPFVVAFNRQAKAPNYTNDIIVQFSAEGKEDIIRKPIRIVEKGFPYEVSASGSRKKQSFMIEVPEGIPFSTHAEFVAYPNILSELTSGLEGMLREPYGCFEQTSSTTYPNILVMQLLKENHQLSQKTADHAMMLIEKGYKRLLSFESKGGGFEWFGGTPAHEGLTAYGLMEYLDMQKIWEGVDTEMVRRTLDWLLSRRDGKGGFLQSTKSLHSFGLTNAQVMNAYIVWALSEHKTMGIEKEVNTCISDAVTSQNPYQLALVANIMMNYGYEKEANEILNYLFVLPENDENLQKPVRYSAIGSSGKALQTETTALALLAALKATQKDNVMITQWVNQLRESKSGLGIYGNTQSTVLTLKALIKYVQYKGLSKEAGSFTLEVDGAKVGELNYTKDVAIDLMLSNLAQFFPVGKHTLTVSQTGNDNSLIPYMFTMGQSVKLLPTHPNCKLSLSTSFSSKQYKVGETARLHIELQNKTDEFLPMCVAIIGIPAGFVLQPWQLKELKDKGLCDFYETKGNTLILYYRNMEKLQKQFVDLDLRVEIPGRFDSPASSAYLYYTNEYKDVTSAGEVLIVP